MQLQTIQGSFKDVPPSHNVFAVMGPEGDTKHIWNKDITAEVEAAKALFKTLVDKGYRAFKVNVKGDQGEGPIKEFDGSEERYIFIPQLQGG